jgi:hypothetical protein
MKRDDGIELNPPNSADASEQDTLADFFKYVLGYNTPLTVALNGHWGIGKTYFWNKFWAENFDDFSHKFERYSYVSVYGASSIEELKASIFFSAVSAQGGKNQKNFMSRAQALLGPAKKLTQSMGGYLQPTFDIGADLLLNQFVKKSLICIDDIERINPDCISPKEVFGLCNHLSEQLNCTVVLIMNPDEIPAGLDVNLLEKTVHHSVTMEPNFNKAARIAFDGLGTFEHAAAGCAERLGIENIRVLQRARFFLNRLKDYKNADHEVIGRDLAVSTVLFSAMKYMSGRFPDRDFVENNQINRLMLTRDGEQNDDTRRWVYLLEKSGFVHFDEVDELLWDFVETGLLDGREFQNRLSEKRSTIEKSDTLEDFERAWDTYHGTFADNADEVVSTIVPAFYKSIQQITPINLAGTRRLLIDLGEDQHAAEILDAYIEAHSENPEFFNLRKNPFIADIDDDELKAAFDTQYQATRPEDDRTVGEVLLSISAKSGWNQEDIALLNQRSIQEYYDSFVSLQGREVSTAVREALSMRTRGNVGTDLYEIYCKASQALDLLALGSIINARRVKALKSAAGL